MAKFRTRALLLLCITGVISTAMAEPTLPPCPNSPNCVSSLSQDASHRIAPLRYEGDLVSAKTRLKEALLQLPRVKIVSETENSLKATQTSLIFRFVDDIEFVFDPPNNVVHVRSASRVGYSDLGVNRKRVEKIRSLFTPNQM